MGSGPHVCLWLPWLTCQTWRIILAYPDNVSKLTPWDNYSSDKQKLGIFTNYWDYIGKFHHAAMDAREGVALGLHGSGWECVVYMGRACRGEIIEVEIFNVEAPIPPCAIKLPFHALSCSSTHSHSYHVTHTGDLFLPYVQCLP